MIKTIDYFDPIMYGGSNPDIPEFEDQTVLPSLNPDDNIPTAQGTPVEITAQPMYVQEYTTPTNEYHDPLGGKTYGSFEEARAAMNPENMYHERDRMKATGFTAKNYGGSSVAAAQAYRKKNKPVNVVTKGLVAEGTGAAVSPSIELYKGAPGTTHGVQQGPGVIPARMGYEFLATHGSTDQQNLAAERLFDLKNFTPDVEEDY